MVGEPAAAFGFLAAVRLSLSLLKRWLSKRTTGGNNNGN